MNDIGFPTYADHPTVSVIIPTFNRRDTLLTRALPSISKQTYRNLEVIIACHGCTDWTQEAVHEWAYRNPDFRVRGINVPRVRRYPPTAQNHWLAGPVDPINAALSYVSGHWIARIDDDDCWPHNHIDSMLRFASEGGYEFVSGGSCVYDKKSGGGRAVAPYDLGGGVKVGGAQTWLYRSYLRFFRYNIDCWRKTWNRVNDTDIQDRMCNAGVRMGYLELVQAYLIPRDEDQQVGLAAYMADRAKYEEKYSFKH
jgi:glycosyltransferase involved in cell wall biosynthesis